MTTYIKQQNEEDRIRAREEKEKIEFQRAGEVSEAQKICEKYKINLDYLKGQEQPFKQQVSQFCVSQNAYLQFKKNATIDRTLKDFNQHAENQKKLKESSIEIERLREENRKFQAKKDRESSI